MSFVTVKLAKHALNQQLPCGWRVLDADGEIFLRSRPEDGDYYEARIVKNVDGHKQYAAVKMSKYFPEMASAEALTAFGANANAAIEERAD